MSTHARGAPSSLALYIACNAALQLQESVEVQPPTDEEAEGTAAHWVARRYLAGHAHELPLGAKFLSEGKQWEVTPDMYAGARLYVRALLSYILGGGIDPEVHIEEKVKIARVHETDCEGTPDMWRYFPDARYAYLEACPEGLPVDRFNAGLIKLLRVGDYKFGHRYVEVFENAQLSAYASGIMDLLGLHDIDDDLYVELILVQPRSYHPDGPVRIWRTKAINLRNILIAANDALERALMPITDAFFAPKAKTGPHCLDCRARHVCVTLQYQNGHIIDFSHKAERAELPPMALGQELMIIQEAIKRLTARETGLAAQADAMLRRGERVPFYHMEAKSGALTYFPNVTADEIVGLGEMAGVNLRKTPKLKDIVVTPTQAIDLGIDPDVMRHYAARSPGKMTLTRDNSVTARKVFSK